MTDHKELIAEAREYADAIQGGENENWMRLVTCVDRMADALEAAQPRQIDRDTVRKVITEKASVLNDYQTNMLTDAILESLSPIPAAGEVEWATEFRVDGSVEHRFPANSEAEARATAAERGEIVASRTVGPWVEVTP